MIEPIGHPHEEVLRDGTTVLVRPIELTAGAALVRFHDALPFRHSSMTTAASHGVAVTILL